MTGAGLAARRSTPRRKARAASPLGQLGTLALRTMLILAVAGVIIAGATTVGSSSLGARIPGTFLPFAGGGRPQGGPDEGAAGAIGNPGQPTGAAPQAGRGRGGPGGAGGVNQTAPDGAPGGAGADQQGIFSGRNMPSLQRGWPEEVRYLALFAVLTAGVVLALRLIRRTRRRPRAVRASAST